ncbi:MAG: ParB N-terminal domain-containing protein [Clostridia bacterium]|nr:ParB N-terminal domain-containing protein [Clostridia bacterium]
MELFKIFNNTNNEAAEKGQISRNAYVRYINSDELQHIIPLSPYEPNDVLSIAESIRRFGLLDPIRVFYDSHKGKYFIISGERRFAALTLLGRTRIMCHVITDPQTRDAIIMAEYCLKENCDIFRAGSALEFLIEDRGYTPTDLSRFSGIPLSRINKLLKLQLLTYEERRRLLAAHMSSQVCCEIAEIDDYSVRSTVIDYIITQTPNVKSAIKEKISHRRCFSFGSEIIDNSIAKLKSLIDRCGLVAGFERAANESDITYTIKVRK